MSLETSKRTLMRGYAAAVLSVGAALIGLSLMESCAQAWTPPAMFLIAIIVSAWVGGMKPGLLALALSMLAFAYFLPHPGSSLAKQPIQVIHLFSFVVTACYVAWITPTKRSTVESFTRVQDELHRSNQALRAENILRERTEEALRVSEAKFRAWFLSTPAAMFVFEGEEIGCANSEASVITGHSCEQLGTMKFRDTVHPDFQDLVTARGLARRRGEAVAVHYELKVVSKSGEERWLEFNERTFEFDGRPAVLAIAFDTTERKQAEQALQDSQQLLIQVLATLPVGVSVTDPAGDIILANAASKRIWDGTMTVCGPERWTNSKGYWHDTRHRIAPTEWASVRALSGGETSLNELIDIETFGGQVKTIQNSAAPIRDAGGSIVGAVIVNEDVTERVRAENALHESTNRLQLLSRRLLAVQEEERRHLSRELHDEFGQLLATITLHLHAAKVVAEEAAQSALDESMALLQRAGAQVRSMALELRPTMLETGGLDSTLRWLAEQHQQRVGIATEVVGHLNDVPGDFAIACFRVAQEALTNVVRHARAEHVWIELSQKDGLVELVVRDNGVGFDVTRTLKRAAGGGNLGLLGMKERVEILGGNLEIDSQRGRGTRIRISLPLAVAVMAQHTA